MKNKKLGRVLRLLLLGVGGVFALLFVAALVVSLIAIPIDLTDHKGLVESTASSALGRKVTLEGEILVTTSLWPVFEMQGMRIANPAGFASARLASMELVHVRVGLLPLLRRKVHVKEFRVAGLALDLIRTESGAMNWAMGSAPASAPEPETPEDADPDQSAGLATDAFAMDRLALENISVSYVAGGAEPLEFVLESLEGTAPYGKPMDVTMHGVLLDESFELSVQANSLGEFLAMTHSQLDLQLEMAGARFEFAGSTATLAGERSLEMEASLEGERLDSLNDLLHLDLPPLQAYRLGAKVRAEPGRLDLSELEIRVGESALTGKMTIDRSGARPTATLDLKSELIQLDDFDVGEWSAEGGEEPQPEGELVEGEEAQPEGELVEGEEAQPDPEPAESAAPAIQGERQAARARIMSPEVLARVDARLTVQVQQVLSGDDNLGGGELKLALQEGRISLDPLHLDVPGGEFLLQASLKPDTQATDASLRVLLKNFDFGVLARRYKPGTDLGGVLNMDLDVQTSAGKIEDLLANANGYIDVSGNPENLEAGIIDLWAVNLVAAVVSSTEKEEASQINCLLTRWTMEDGKLSVDNLAIDTSKIRICGKGSIDFKEEQFDLVVAPTAKRPEYFSLATPLVAKGGFEDFRIGVKRGALAKTGFKFLFSPVTTSAKRLVKENLPEDGSDICGLPIGPRDGEKIPKLPGC